MRKIGLALKTNKHDHSSTATKRGIFYTVRCDVHGKKYAHTPDQKVLVVGAIAGRPAKNAGCPLCKEATRHDQA